MSWIIPVQEGVSRADFFASFCSGVWQQSISHVPSPRPLRLANPAYSGHFHLISSPTFAADSGTQPFCLGRLAGWVWWLLAVVCTRCINKVGKKTSDIFSFSLLCGTRNCNMWKGNTVTGINIPFFFSLVSSPFFLSHGGLCIPLSYSCYINSTEPWWGLNSVRNPRKGF